MLKIVLATQYSLCAMSMMLTGLFAASLSNVDFTGEGNNLGSYYSVLTLCIFIGIGICVDTGKYLFWFYRERSWFYGVNSVLLTLFSLVASLAFFENVDDKVQADAVRQTRQFQAIEEEIVNIKNEKARRETLVDLRLSSRYHDQWKAAETGSDYLKQLSEKIVELNDKKESMLNNPAEALTTEANINVNGSIWRAINSDLFRGICFAVFAALIEISSLSAISLSRNIRSNSYHEDQSEFIEINSTDDSYENATDEDRLIKDIREGKVKPSVRAIKRANYGLGTRRIQKMLRQLVQNGVLQPGSRGGYILGEVDPAPWAKN